MKITSTRLYAYGERRNLYHSENLGESQVNRQVE